MRRHKAVRAPSRRSFQRGLRTTHVPAYTFTTVRATAFCGLPSPNQLERTTMTKLLLTPDLIRDELACPAGKSKIELCDTEVPGFRVEVTARSPGRGIYYFSYKSEGKRTHRR